MKKPLNDALLRSLKPREKTYRLSDTLTGLYIEVRPKGRPFWLFRYIRQGKETRLSLGPYPEIPLLEARRRAMELRSKLAHGEDVGALRRRENASRREEKIRAASTFQAVALEWLKVMGPEWMPRHAFTVRSRLAKDVFPHLGEVPVDEITAPMVLKCLQEGPLSRGQVDTATKEKIIIGQILRYAASQGLAMHDATAVLRGALPKKRQKNFHHVLEPRELGNMLLAFETYGGSLPVQVALRLTPMLLLRPGELRTILWREVDLASGELRLDHDAPELDPERDSRKLHKDLVVPLPRQALGLLKSLHPLTGHGRFVFPSQRTLPGSPDERPMSEGAVSAALKKLGLQGKQTPHGFRHTASTLLNELGFHGDAVERQLSHEPRDSIRGIYDKSSRMEERRVMMQTWADYLDRLKAGKDG